MSLEADMLTAVAEVMLDCGLRRDLHIAELRAKHGKSASERAAIAVQFARIRVQHEKTRRHMGTQALRNGPGTF